jgi:ABC-type multidrug transport system fused ATPase/permease subunit
MKRGDIAGRTVIVIAHRLSTVASLDRSVLDHGTVVEDGSDEQQFAGDSVYGSLWQRQSGGALGTRRNAGRA